MNVRTWVLPLLAALVLLPQAVAGQSTPQVTYRFDSPPTTAHLDEDGRAVIDFRVGADFQGFACATPLELTFRVEVEPTNATWDQASIASPPPRVVLLPPGPWNGGVSSQFTVGRLVLAWDLAHAPMKATQEYWLRMKPPSADTSNCFPRPMMLQGSPQRLNLTACRQPHPDGLGAGCKPLEPLQFPAARTTPGPELAAVGLALLAAVIVARRPR